MRMRLLTAILLFSLPCFHNVQAQVPDAIVARAVYNYEHILDTTHKDVRYKEIMLLALGRNASVFTSLSKIYQTRNFEQQAAEQTKAYTGNDFPVITYNVGRYTTSTQIYRFLAERKCLIKENLIQDYLYEEPLPDIHWQLTGDTVNIKGISCQKAKATFRGRVWIVAFAPGLPFSSGPWLLGGLPGLIVDARDERGEVSYALDGFETTKAHPTSYQLSEYKPTDYSLTDSVRVPAEKIRRNNRIKLVRASKTEVIRLQKLMDQDVKTFRSIQLKAANGIIFDEEAFQTLQLKPVINNPIDRQSSKQ